MKDYTVKSYITSNMSKDFKELASKNKSFNKTKDDLLNEDAW